jgi:hypothetical protein
MAFNGDTSVSDRMAIINEDTCANIVDSAPDTLLSVSNIIDSGNNKVSFSKTESTITNYDNNTCISFPRSQDGLWRIPMESLISTPTTTTSIYDYNNSPSTHFSNNHNISHQLVYSASLAGSTPRNIKQKVYSLHSRMGHASMENMCKAISQNGSWKNSGVTIKDIRTVMLSEPCLVCALSKRNLASPIVSTDHRQWLPGACICVDPVPRISPQSYNGDIGFFTLSTWQQDICIQYQQKVTIHRKLTSKH